MKIELTKPQVQITLDHDEALKLYAILANVVGLGILEDFSNGLWDSIKESLNLEDWDTAYYSEVVQEMKVK